MQGTHVHLRSKEEAGHGVERALSRRLGTPRIQPYLYHQMATCYMPLLGFGFVICKLSVRVSVGGEMRLD